MSVAITVEKLSKKYVISHLKHESGASLRDALARGGKRFRNMLLYPFSVREDDFAREEFWALKDVDFEIRQGERVGIIGRNGAGKSTLLKVLSRITEPSSGKISIRGRVASLLEVGTGFHPELTGRENIYLNGAILGMRRNEIKKKFDEIVSFAEVERFLDTPVKRYSSGMYVRLAFSVAAHLEPEILIVDEVLAVGDAQFQKKCMGKMESVGNEGRTVLFVSHNMVALKSLCERAIWLNEGCVIKNGETQDVVSSYLQNSSPTNMWQVWNDPESAPGNKSVRLHSVKISYKGDASGEMLTIASPVDLEFEFLNLEQGAQLNFSVLLYDGQGVCIFNTVSSAEYYPRGKVKGVCYVPGNLLNDGVYRVRLLIVKNMSFALIDLENAATFEVHDIEREGTWYGKFSGAVRPKLNWETSVYEEK